MFFFGSPGSLVFFLAFDFFSPPPSWKLWEKSMVLSKTWGSVHKGLEMAQFRNEEISFKVGSKKRSDRCHGSAQSPRSTGQNLCIADFRTFWLDKWKFFFPFQVFQWKSWTNKPGHTNLFLNILNPFKLDSLELDSFKLDSKTFSGQSQDHHETYPKPITQ